MPITYEKYINSLGCYAEIDGQSDVVFTIRWQYSGTEDKFYSSVMCDTSIPYIAGQSFIPYSELTKDQVLAWIDEYTEESKMLACKEYIDNGIAKQKEIQYPPLPWEPVLPIVANEVV